MRIDNFVVVHVDKGTKVRDGDSNQRQAPEWKELDQPVGVQSGKESLNLLVSIRRSKTRGEDEGKEGPYRDAVDDIFHEQNALEFKKAKVKDLHKVLQNGFKGLLRDGVVFAGTERACHALAQDKSTTKLSRSGD